MFCQSSELVVRCKLNLSRSFSFPSRGILKLRHMKSERVYMFRGTNDHSERQRGRERQRERESETERRLMPQSKAKRQRGRDCQTPKQGMNFGESYEKGEGTGLQLRHSSFKRLHTKPLSQHRCFSSTAAGSLGRVAARDRTSFLLAAPRLGTAPCLHLQSPKRFAQRSAPCAGLPVAFGII